MKEQEIIEKLKDAYKVVVGEDAPEEGFSLASDLRTDLGLSSIGMLYYVIVIESMFTIRFEGVGVENFKTLGDVVSYIGEKTEQ